MQAEEIAEKLCESVAASLEGKKPGSFTRISSTAQVCSTHFVACISTFYKLVITLRFDGHSCRRLWRRLFFAF
jgi:signal recognition particle receptor subunit alpha